MIKYNKSKIYKIQPKGEFNEGEIYIGSTTKQYLSQRMAVHRNGYKMYLNKKDISHLRVFLLFDKYGVENCEILLLENVNCNSVDELYARERFYIETLKCVNKVIPLRTPQEYYNAHRLKIIKQTKEYVNLNPEKVKDFRKKYAQINKDKIKEYKTNYNDLKIICECGGKSTRSNRCQHIKTIKHCKFIENKN